MTRDEVYTELIGSGYGPASIEDMLVEAYGIADILSYINTDVDSGVGGLDNLILKAESISDILGLPSVDLLPFFWDTAKPKVSPNSRPDPEWSYAGALPDGQGGTDSSGDPVVHDEGAWCGPGYTQQIINSSASGAIIGNPGTLPTNWLGGANPLNGITWSVVGVGSGYVDIRWQGTATTTFFPSINFQLLSEVPASVGTVWNGSCCIDILDATNLPNQMRLALLEVDSGFVFLAQSAETFTTSRCVEIVRTLIETTVAYTGLVLGFSFNISETVDFTLRISKPQLTQGPYKLPFLSTSTGTISVVSAAATTGDNGLNVPMDTRMLAAFNGTLTLAALVTMGVGSDELANDTAVRSVLTPINSTLNTLYYFKGGDGRSTIVGSADGTTFLESVSTPWARNERHLKIVQTNTAGTQFRVGNLRIGIDSSIQWSSWAAFDGSFDPLTYLRYMLNTTVPMWMRQVQLWSDGEVADSEILKLAERYGHA